MSSLFLFQMILICWPRHERDPAEIIMDIDTDMKMEKIAPNNKY